MTEPDIDQKESPDSVAAEIGAQGVEALPARVDRYGSAKQRAIDVAEYMRASAVGQELRIAHQIASCGEWLAFRHYFTADVVRLHAASFCRRHLLCPLCAIRRGSKTLEAYLGRWEALRASRPALRAYLVTLTVANGPDLAERFRHLYNAQRELWMRKHRGRGSVLDLVGGAVWSYEVKRGSGSGLWHPHLHMIALAESMTIEGKDNPGPLAAEWKDITGDSHMVDVRPIDQAEPVSGFLEVFKYAVKVSDMEPADALEAFRCLQGKRLIGSAGAFRGVHVPEALTDEPLDSLPFVELFFRWMGKGYGLAGQSERRAAEPAPRRSEFVRLMTR